MISGDTIEPQVNILFKFDLDRFLPSDNLIFCVWEYGAWGSTPTTSSFLTLIKVYFPLYGVCRGILKLPEISNSDTLLVPQALCCGGLHWAQSIKGRQKKKYLSEVGRSTWPKFPQPVPSKYQILIGDKFWLVLVTSVLHLIVTKFWCLMQHLRPANCGTFRDVIVPPRRPFREESREESMGKYIASVLS